jgi:hypothetical protein
MKENNYFSETKLKQISEPDEISPKLNEEDHLQEQYVEYRKSLIYYKECPACHYVQGMVFLGIGFFTAIRLQFIWASLKWPGIFKYALFSIIFSSIGVYKITYAYHVFQSQGNLRKKH